MDFVIPAGRRVKNKGSEKKDKYLDLARELRNLWDMKVIAIVTGALETVLKGLERELEESEIGGRIKTIKTDVLLRSARMLRRVLETSGDLLSLRPPCNITI